MNAVHTTQGMRSVRRWYRAPVDGLAAYLHTAPYLVRWIVLGCLIGCIAGLGAVAFIEMLHLGTYLFLNVLGGYQIPTVASEGTLAGSAGFARPWAIPLLVAVGADSSAPLGGALLSAEILYHDDTEVEAIVPSLLASAVGYTIFGSIEGFDPMFGFVVADYNFTHPAQLGWYTLIGLVAGGIGLLYSRSFHGLKALFARLPGPAVLRPAIGGLLTGLLALGVPQVLGTGYGWIQQGLDQNLANLPLVVAALPLAKILSTSLSIGSGGSGGIFGPGMVIGAFTGLALWRVLEPFAPAIPPHPAPFVIVGMMACFGPICRAPLAVMLMVAEMTGWITTVIPALIAVGLSYLIVHHFGETIYRSQLGSRSERAEQGGASR